MKAQVITSNEEEEEEKDKGITEVTTKECDVGGRIQKRVTRCFVNK